MISDSSGSIERPLGVNICTWPLVHFDIQNLEIGSSDSLGSWEVFPGFWDDPGWIFILFVLFHVDFNVI